MVDSVFSSAINAYQQASKMGGNKAGAAGADAPKRIMLSNGEAAATPEEQNRVGKPSFPELLEHSIDSSMNNQYKGEDTSVKTLVRKAELHEMVTAVTHAELTLQTVVAVRDKVIGAYQDILKMPI